MSYRPLNYGGSLQFQKVPLVRSGDMDALAGIPRGAQMSATDCQSEAEASANNTLCFD